MHYNTPVNSERAYVTRVVRLLPAIVRSRADGEHTVFSFLTVSLKTKREYFDGVRLHNHRYVYIYIANVIKSLSLVPARSSTCNTTHKYIFIFYSNSGFAHAQAW